MTDEEVRYWAEQARSAEKNARDWGHRSEEAGRMSRVWSWISVVAALIAAASFFAEVVR